MSWRSPSSGPPRSWPRPGPGWPGRCPDSATRLVSLHDPDARPIRKGRIDRPVEFGYKAQVTDNDDGIILDYGVEYGAAPDGPQLAPAIEPDRAAAPAACRARSPPTAATASPRSSGTCTRLGVRTVAIPRQAKTSAARKAVEHGRGFRRLVKWRTGCEGRISYLKRGYGWDRTRLDGTHGAAIWCGHGVFAHNLVKIGALASLTRPEPSRACHRTSRPNSALRLFQVEVAKCS